MSYCGSRRSSLATAPGARQAVDLLDWTQMFRINDLRHVS
jgi:hypothetical protein